MKRLEREQSKRIYRREGERKRERERPHIKIR